MLPESDAIVLLVDDKPENLRVLTECLREVSLKLLVAEDGETALKRVTHLKPDLILLDIILPGIDGFETCRRLKASEATADIPILFMTALADTPDKIKGFEAGAVDYIAKPFQIEEVLARIKTHISLKRLCKELEEKNVTLHQEIAERKKAEEALQESEARFRQQFESTPVPTFIWKYDEQHFVLLDYNSAADRLTQGAAQQFVGMSAAQIYPDRPDLLDNFHACLEQQRLIVYETDYHARGTGLDRVIMFTYVYVAPDLIMLHTEDITDRKRTEEALQESEKRLASIYNTAGDVIFLLDVEQDGEYRFNSVNPTFLSTTGLPVDAVVGRHVKEVISEPSLTLVLDKYRQAIRENTIVRWEETSDYPTGTLTGLVSVAPILDNDGTCTHLVGTVRDITDRKKAEEKIRFQAHLLDSVEQAVIATTPEGTVIYLNAFAETLYGWSAEEAIGRHVIDVTVPHVTAEQAQDIMSRLMQGESWQGEFLVQRRDGSSFLAYVVDSPVYNEAGKMVGIVEVSSDITSRKQAEEALWESEERFRRLAENARDMIYRMSLPDGQYEYVSPASNNVFGYSQDEFYSSPVLISKIIHPDWQDYFVEEWGKLLAGDMSPSYEYQIIHKSGEVRWLSQRNVLVQDESGHPIAIEGIVTDITQRKRTEEQLRIALKEKTALIQEIHHRVKNNLQAVSSLLYLQAEKAVDEGTRKIFEENRNRILSMAFVHEQLYASQHLSHINMAEYIKELVSHLYHSYQIDSEHVALRLTIEPLVLNIEQAILCGLLIQELVSNAFKHAFPSGKRGELGLSLREDQGRCILIVRNTGLPFPQEIDLHAADTMGLDLINTFTAQLQGMIQLDRGDGTTFTITFSKNNSI